MFECQVVDLQGPPFPPQKNKRKTKEKNREAQKNVWIILFFCQLQILFEYLIEDDGHAASDMVHERKKNDNTVHLFEIVS